MYVDDFRSAVQQEPQTMIGLVLEHKNKDLKTHRASYFCEIIEKMNSNVWSAEVLNQLKHIALKHENPALEQPNVTSPEDKEMKSCQMLSSNALNCVRGQAARAIGNLLWEDKILFTEFRAVIEGLVVDKKFLQEIVISKAGKKIVWSFIHYLEENALSIVDYFSI